MCIIVLSCTLPSGTTKFEGGREKHKVKGCFQPDTPFLSRFRVLRLESRLPSAAMHSLCVCKAAGKNRGRFAHGVREKRRFKAKSLVFIKTLQANPK
jgi:hypothetical protein